MFGIKIVNKKKFEELVNQLDELRNKLESRNEEINNLNNTIDRFQNEIEKLNNKSFQKRSGSRKIIFEVEEKPLLRNLPLIPFEICEWSYGRKVNPNSHVWFDKGQYSVPSDYIGSYVDIRYSTSIVMRENRSSYMN